MSRVWLGAALVQVMSAEDDVAHLISFPLHEAGLLVGEGRYIALVRQDRAGGCDVDGAGTAVLVCRAAMNAGA